MFYTNTNEYNITNIIRKSVFVYNGIHINVMPINVMPINVMPFKNDYTRNVYSGTFTFIYTLRLYEFLNIHSLYDYLYAHYVYMNINVMPRGARSPRRARPPAGHQ